MASVTAPAPAPAPETKEQRYLDHGQPLWRRILLTREMAIIGLLVAVIIVASAVVPRFGTTVTLGFLLLDVTPILLIALPMTLVIITGEIDLSVASMVGLSCVIFGVLHQAGLSIPIAALFALVVGAIGGTINGLLVTAVGLPSLAVTIGTLALYRGLAVGILGTTAVTDFPRYWTQLAKDRMGETGIPIVMILVAILAVIFAVVLHFTPFGRGIYAIGLSAEAAQFSGVRVKRTKLILFVVIGIISALAGIYYTLRFGSSRGDNATGMELQVIAAVLLGGVSIFGGRGALHGVIGGVLLIGVLASALRLANVTSDVINIITGVLLVLSVVSSSILAWVQSKRAKPESHETPRQPSMLPATAGNNLERNHMKIGNKLRTVAVVAAASLAFTAAGCGGGGDSGGEAAPGAEASAPAEDANLAITFLPKNLGNPYFDVSAKGGEAAVKEFGGNFAEVGPAEATPDAQVSYINTLTQQQVGAIVISANDKQAVCDALTEARDAGVKVVTFDSDTNPDCRDLYVNQATADGIAKVQIDMIAEQIGDSGEIAILSASANATNQNAWIELMKKELANHPNIKLVDTVYGNDKDQESFDKTAALLQSHPDLKGIISPTTVGIAAAARYLSTSKAKGKVALTGLGTPNQMREYVKDGTVKEFALWNPEDLGYLSAFAAKAIITGEIQGNEGDKFTAGKLGEKTVGADKTVLLGDPFQFNKENIDQFDF